MKKIIAEKQQLRKFFQEKRTNLSTEKKHKLSKLISQNFINFLLKNNIDFENKIFGSFIATNSEADPSYI